MSVKEYAEYRKGGGGRKLPRVMKGGGGRRWSRRMRWRWRWRRGNRRLAYMPPVAPRECGRLALVVISLRGLGKGFINKVYYFSNIVFPIL